MRKWKDGRKEGRMEGKERILFTFHVSRFTPHISRIPFQQSSSRFTFHASRNTFLLLLLCLSVFISFIGCNEPEEKNPVIPTQKKLPDEKTVLLKYHRAELLTTEIESAPLLSQENHPHGWQKADCTRCHRPPAPVEVNVCSDCHGQNGVNNQVDTCRSCHKVQSEFGAPSTGSHLAHVLKGPKDQDCTQCHPGRQNSKVHANGMVNVVFAGGGKFTPTTLASGTESGCSGVACHETRPWESGSCSSCHGNPPDTGVHTVHLNQPNLTCRDCHAGNQHDNDKNSGSIEIGGIKYNTITGDCTSTCHENKALKWGCNSCHEYPPKDGNNDGTVHNFSCDQCHSDHSHSYVAAIRPLDFRDAKASFARGGTYHDSTNDGTPNGTCSGVGCHEERVWGSKCTDCHGNPPNTSTHVVHVVRERLKCRDCHGEFQHDLDKTSGRIEIGGGSLTKYDPFSGDCMSSCHQRQQWTCDTCHGFPPQSGTHLSHNMPEGNFLGKGKIACNLCHATHQHSYNAAIDPRDFTNVRVTFAGGGNFNPATRTCSGTGCHEPMVWGSRCEDCHGEPPSTGSHLVHVGKDNITCDTCHKGRQHDLDDRSGAIDVAGDFTYNSLTGDCATSCHLRVEQWGCQSCHSNPPLTGQHQVHAVKLKFECRICHSDHQHSFKAAITPNDQRDATVKFTVRGVWNPAAQTCTSVGCHGDMKW